MKTIYPKIQGMSCAGCAVSCEKILSKTQGVKHAEVNFATEKAAITFDDEHVNPDQFIKSLSKSGYNLILEPEKNDTQNTFENIQDNDKLQKSEKLNKVRLIISLVFAGILLYIAMAPMISFITLPYPSFLSSQTYPLRFAIIQLVLVIPILLSGYQFFTRGYRHLFQLMPNMDSLVAIGTTASFLYSVYNIVLISKGIPHAVHQLYFESSGVIIALVMLGKHLESRSKKKTSSAIRKLIMLSPNTATIMIDGKETIVPIHQVVPGDMVVVKPGERIPCDGNITSGYSVIDESMLTGESIPVDKNEGELVFCGTMNTTGSFIFQASSTGSKTLLAKITRLVEEASGSKAPAAKLADKVSGIFVPIVTIISIVSFIIWYLVTKDFDFSLKIFVSVLVIACPCALGLATPTAIISGTGRGATLGILFRDAAALQNIHKATVFCFDKTGTITTGHPEIVGVFPQNPFTETELLKIVASGEKKSEHPLAKAVIKYAENKNIELYDTEKFTAIPGKGIICKINGKMCKIGKDDFVDIPKDEIDDKHEYDDQIENATFLHIEYDGQYAGKVAAADEIRNDSKQIISTLQRKGIEAVMITGDNKKTAELIAKKAGISRVISGVLPDGKADVVKTLQQEKNKSGHQQLVVMVGDGINDAPALSQADFGVAVATGTDIAMESADVVLTGDGLSKLLPMIDLSHAVLKNIRQNLFWAFCYNTIGIPVAAGVLYAFGGFLLNPMIAAAAMSFSSISVITNALRLNTWKYKLKEITKN